MVKVSRGNWLSNLLFLAILTGVVLRIVNLGSREFWYDEILSLLLSTSQKVLYHSPQAAPVRLSSYIPLLSLPQDETGFFTTIENLLKGLVAEPHPPLFFIEQHLWMRLFGNSEIALRSLVVLFSLGAIFAAYGLGRSLMGNHRGGLILAALLALNPYYLFQSLNARMYGSVVFWMVLSSWALLELIILNQQEEPWQGKIVWTLIFIISVAAGLMTVYYFAFALLGLLVIILILDLERWWQYGLCLGMSVIINVPWLWWGTRQQLNNADLDRFNSSGSWLESMGRHLQDVIQTFATLLVVGDWVTSLPKLIIIIAGCVAIAFLILCTLNLIYIQQHQLLIMALSLGVLPLLVILGIDIFTGKFTLGYGWGRSIIFILPGCLLLIAIWLERYTDKWESLAVIAVLILYLGIGVSDFVLRPRLMFHQIADIINKQPKAPTLIVTNSSAWGNVLRLAYYLPSDAPISLLAQKSESLTPILKKTLNNKSAKYQRILWLDSARPVWGSPSTKEQKQQLKKALDSRFKLTQTKQLSGTGVLDKFMLQVYQKKS